MDGFYSIWTKPFKLQHNGVPFFMNDYELLTFLMSVIVYKNNNGKVRLYADNDAIKYIKSIGLDEIFDDGIIEIKVDESINPKVFWAAGKLESLKVCDKPSVMIDLDLIIWKNLDVFFTDANIYGIHQEHIRPEIYPSIDFFKMREDYKFPEGLNIDASPINTAMLYINDLDFQHIYANASLDFMKACVEQNENLKHMVFAEQRLLPMLARNYNMKIKTMFPFGEDIGIQDYFTHVWGHKNILRYNKEERDKFCKKIIKRIYSEYPAYIKFIENNKVFSTYLK